MKTLIKFLNNSVVLGLLLVSGISLDLVLLGRKYDLNRGEWASWVQAVGSIIALGVAIFVMSRQNAHAARLIVAADKLALRRRAAAVRAIVTRSLASINATYKRIDPSLTTGVSDADYMNALKTASKVIGHVLPALTAIPAHELGSFKMANGIVLTVVTAEAMKHFVDDMIGATNIRHPGWGPVLKSYVEKLNQFSKMVDDGSAEFD